MRHLQWPRVGLACAALLLAAGCSEKAVDHMASAQAAIASGDALQAIIHLKNVIAAEPNNAAARIQLARQLLATGNAEAAIVELRRARELKAPADDAAPPLAEALLAAGRDRLVIEEFSGTVLQSASAADSLAASLAAAYLRAGQPAQARLAAQRTLQAHPTAKRARLVLARVALVEGGREAAMREVDDLLKSDPKFDTAWTFKGGLHEMVLEEQEQALAAYAKALEINPRQVEALSSTVSVRLNKGELDKAETALKQLANQWPNSMAAIYLDARLAFIKGEHERARPLFATVINALPNNEVVLGAAALNELKLNAPIQAEALLARAVSVAPADTVSRFHLARAHLLTGRPEAAWTAISPLVDAASPSVEVLVVAAQAKLLMGDERSADMLYRRASAMPSTDSGVRTALATARLARGEVEPAIRELEALSLSTDELQADLQIIGARLAKKDFQGALSATQRLEKKKGGAAPAAEIRGRLLLAQGDTAAAKRSFEEALQTDRIYMPALTQLTSLEVRQGETETAKGRLNTILKANPNQADVMVLLATVLANTGAESQEVHELLDRAVRADPLHLSAWLMKIARLQAAGEVRAAQGAAETAIARIPSNVQLLELLGRIQIRAGDYRQAAATFTNITKVAPRSPSGYIGQAAALLALGEAESASKALRRYLDIDDRSTEAWKMLAEVAVVRRQYPEALATARKLQSLQAGSSAGLVLEGQIEKAQGRWPAAAVAFRKALNLEKTGANAALLHQSLLQSGGTSDADELARNWVSFNPKDTAFPTYLADLAISRKEWRTAQVQLRRVLSLEADNAAALNNLAWTQLQLKEPDALTTAEQAAKLAPSDPAVLDTLAQAQAAAGQLSKAIETLRRAINRAVDSNALRLSLAELLIRSGDQASAMKELERVVETGRGTPQFAPARQRLAELRRK